MRRRMTRDEADGEAAGGFPVVGTANGQAVAGWMDLIGTCQLVEKDHTGADGDVGERALVVVEAEGGELVAARISVEETVGFEAKWIFKALG